MVVEVAKANYVLFIEDGGGAKPAFYVDLQLFWRDGKNGIWKKKEETLPVFGKATNLQNIRINCRTVGKGGGHAVTRYLQTDIDCYIYKLSLIVPDNIH